MVEKFATLSRRQKRAQSRPKAPRSVRVIVYLTEAESDDLDRAAEERRTPMSSYLRFLVEKGLESVATSQAAGR